MGAKVGGALVLPEEPVGPGLTKCRAPKFSSPHARRHGARSCILEPLWKGLCTKAEQNQLFLLVEMGNEGQTQGTEGSTVVHLQTAL